MKTSTDLFPPIEPYEYGYLPVDNGHKIYYEQCGNRNGYPILFIHGGPGAGCDKMDRRFFDPEKWKVILFDQRGSGRSKPFGSLKTNNTWALASDIWTLRKELGIEKFVLFGGSWGSTLALVYSILYPRTVSGMVLRGIFLGEADEIDSFTNGSVALFRPQVWERFIGPVPPEHKRNPYPYYRQQLNSDDPETRKKFAYEWAFYEMSLLHLNPLPEEKISEETTSFSFESLALMETHYFAHNCFLEDRFIIRNANCLPSVPISIVQGDWDLVCPPISAYRLHKALPTSTLHMVLAGHSSSDPEIRKKLISETDAMFDRV